MKLEEQKLREAIREAFEDYKSLLTKRSYTPKEYEKFSQYYNNGSKALDNLYVLDKKQNKYIRRTNLKEDVNPDFMDKVDEFKENEFIDALSDISVQLNDIQKKLVKFRPKLVDSLAKATAVIDYVQNKLVSTEDKVPFKGKNPTVYEFSPSDIENKVIPYLEKNNISYDWNYDMKIVINMGDAKQPEEVDKFLSTVSSVNEKINNKHNLNYKK